MEKKAGCAASARVEKRTRLPRRRFPEDSRTERRRKYVAVLQIHDANVVAE